MLNENIKNLRKAKGYSQETFATQLNVVRQTVSKWEKGLSVPDAVTLEKMADILEVSVSELLGSQIMQPEATDRCDEIAKQLAIMNEQLAYRESGVRKRWSTFKKVIFGIFLLMFIGAIMTIFGIIGYKASPSYDSNDSSIEVQLSSENDD